MIKKDAALVTYIATKPLCKFVMVKMSANTNIIVYIKQRKWKLIAEFLEAKDYEVSNEGAMLHV